MFYDLVSMKRNPDAEAMGKTLGFGKIFFLEDLEKLGVVEGKNEGTNRRVVEEKKTKIIMNPQQEERNDRLHYRSSGLNQVICGLAHERNIAIAMSLDQLQDAKTMGRAMQNIRLCRKYKVKMLFCSGATSVYGMR